MMWSKYFVMLLVMQARTGWLTEQTTVGQINFFYITGLVKMAFDN